MSVLRLLLLPLAFIFDLITRIRNKMYDTGWKPSVGFDLPVICIGNLTVGGSGKTPMVEYLIRLLGSSTNVATLSRGYGRRTKGFRVGSAGENAKTIGDEPYQIYSKFGSQVPVVVCEDRVFAIPNILNQFPKTRVILLDDAFQHRRVKPGISILLTDYHKPFYNDYLLPYGRLRESSSGAKRADVIVVTKCPDHISDEEMTSIRSRIHQVAAKPIFFSTIRYGLPQPMHDHIRTCAGNVVLVTGIANPEVVLEYVKENFNLQKHFEYADHHYYTLDDLLEIEDFISINGITCILTTDKDRAKLLSCEVKDMVQRLPFFSLPIAMEFVQNGKEFDAIVQDFAGRG